VHKTSNHPKTNSNDLETIMQSLSNRDSVAREHSIESDLSRRRWLGGLATGIGSLACQSAFAQPWSFPSEQASGDKLHVGEKKKVAAVVTVYRKKSHADVLVGKILEGWQQDGGPGPDLQLVSLYVDQYPAEDMSVELSKKHGFRMCKTIEEALTLGSDNIQVDGVLSIGEHGEYPWNQFGQHLYPRKRFFQEITDAMAKHRRVVPVFNDKHPGPEWNDALWMAQRAKELQVPWMAGSSLTVSYRTPDADLGWQQGVSAAVGIGYSGLDIYGIHTLEFLQSILERRRGAERGVAWVQALPTDKIGSLLDQGLIHSELFDQALKATGTDRQAVLKDPPQDGAAFLIGYVDGLVVPVLMLPGRAQGIGAAVLDESGRSFATRVEEREEPYYPHFAYLLKGIERMIHSGKPAYPIERTLLTAGILDHLLVSLREGNRKIESSDLRIAYQPLDYRYAPHLKLDDK
jgi:hypothetical protein